MFELESDDERMKKEEEEKRRSLHPRVIHANKEYSCQQYIMKYGQKALQVVKPTKQDAKKSSFVWKKARRKKKKSLKETHPK